MRLATVCAFSSLYLPDSGVKIYTGDQSPVTVGVNDVADEGGLENTSADVGETNEAPRTWDTEVEEQVLVKGLLPELDGTLGEPAYH